MRWQDNIQIVPAKLGEDCGLIGAAHLAFINGKRG